MTLWTGDDETICSTCGHEYGDHYTTMRGRPGCADIDPAWDGSCACSGFVVDLEGRPTPLPTISNMIRLLSDSVAVFYEKEIIAAMKSASDVEKEAQRCPPS